MPMKREDGEAQEDRQGRQRHPQHRPALPGLLATWISNAGARPGEHRWSCADGFVHVVSELLGRLMLSW